MKKPTTPILVSDSAHESLLIIIIAFFHQTKIRNNKIQNCFLHKNLQILIAIFFHKMYILLINLKY